MFKRKQAYLMSSITAQKMEFSIRDFFSKCDQIRSFLRIWSHVLMKSLMENFVFCAVNVWGRMTSFSVVICSHFQKQSPGGGL